MPKARKTRIPKRPKRKPYQVWYGRYGAVDTIFAKSMKEAKRKAKNSVRVTSRPKTWGK